MNWTILIRIQFVFLEGQIRITKSGFFSPGVGSGSFPPESATLIIIEHNLYIIVIARSVIIFSNKKSSIK